MKIGQKYKYKYKLAIWGVSQEWAKELVWRDLLAVTLWLVEFSLQYYMMGNVVFHQEFHY